MKKYDTYKDSGIQWIGQIPAGWKISKLKYISKFINGFAFASNLFSPDEGCKVIRIGDICQTIDYNSCIRAKIDASIVGQYRIHENDVLVAMSGATTGKSCLVNSIEEAYINQRVGIIRSPSYKFIHYMLNIPSFYQYIMLNNAGSAQPNISSTAIEDYQIPLPPLSEQQAIVEFLDKKTGEIDKAISLFEQEKLDLLAYRKAIISETVTKGLNPNAKLKDSGIQWIGQIPEEWSVRKCSRVFDTIGSGQTPKSDKPIYYSEAGYNWLQTGDLNDSLISNTSKKISEEAMQDYNLTQYPVESVVVAMYGATIGKIGYLQIETTTNQACCVLNSKSVMRNKYAYYVFLSAKTELINMSNGGGQPNISQSIIRNFIIPLPPLSEQEAIVAFLDKKTSDIDTAIERIKSQITELQAYRTALISEAVTGKIDVR